ncbi:YHS domain protein [Poriferisphaera corsica]|uniref:YHS domain protein n=1 Tax=Poriferisphaera corsica TaxID=2528020 RepID=A0A517YV61_9BACT|nr:YHS domain-containing (seleno)protein [Poriferisphaera corsica]QDU34133.1 YHS domain protein [Poriferisphaera corsica]
MRKLKIVMIAYLLLAVTSLVFAAKDEAVNTVGVEGYDLISYHDVNGPIVGNGNHVAVYDGTTYLFANDENKALFEKDPEKYIPAYGGFCAYGMANGYRFAADPMVWKMVDGKLYLNFSQKVQENWEDTLSENIEKANIAWDQIKDDGPDASVFGVQGYDLVSYLSGEPKRGSTAYLAKYKGVTYLFENRQNKSTFEKDPEKYLPAYGGYCAYGVSVGQKFVGDPMVWKIVDDKLYLNLDKKIQGVWSEDIPNNIKKADVEWKNLKNN